MLNQIINLTVRFIIIAFVVIVIYDIIAVIYQTKKGVKNKLGLITISTVFKKWYSEKPIVPYMFAVIFIGHVGVSRWVEVFTYKARLIIYLILAVSSIIWFSIEMIRTKRGKSNSKFYNALCKFWPFSMVLGIIVGSFWGVHE